MVSTSRSLCVKGVLLAVLWAGALCAIGPLGCGSETSRDAQVVVIGLDGATWDLIQPWIDRGDLPHLAELQQSAAWGELHSSVVYLSPPAWTTAVTGVNPGRHAIYDFLRLLPQDTVVVNETSKSRRAQPIWRMLNAVGKRVLLMNIPMTDPPDPVDGLFIAGFPHLDKTGFTYPPELEDRLGEYELDELQMRLVPGTEDSLIQSYHQDLRNRLRITVDWLRNEPFDLLWMVFTATDRIQHTFWEFIDPQNPNYDPEEAAVYEKAILDLWVSADSSLGAIMDLLGPDVNLMVLSDHGFGPMRFDLKLKNYLLRPGSSLRDWEVNHVYVLDPSDAARIYIARKGRDARAQLNEAEARRVRDKVVAELKRAVDPQSGTLICDQVWLGEDVFEGRYMEKGPDIVVVPAYGYFLIFGDMEPDASDPYVAPHGTQLSGWHRMNGIFAFQGPHVQPGRVERPADRAYDLADIVPTVLYLMGEPIPEGLDGELMRGTIAPLYLQNNPPQWTAPLEEEDRELTDEEIEQLRAVQGIPYIGG